MEPERFVLANMRPVVTETAEAEGPHQQETESQRRRRPRPVASLLTFLAAAGLILVYGLRGGSYDLVVFQEHGLVVWWVLALGFAFGLLPRTRPSRHALLLIGALGAYAAWIALSLTWTVSTERTVQELARSLGYLGLVVLAICALDRHTWRWAAAGLGCGAMLVCVEALGTHLVPGIFGQDRIDATLGLDRLSAPFGYWNAVAAFGVMCAALGLAWSAHDSSRVRRGLALALVPVATLTTYLTYSRASLFGVGLGLLAVLVLSRNRLTVLLHVAVAAAGSALAILAVRHAPQVAHATGTAGASSVLGALLFACALGALVAVLTSLGRTDRWSIPSRIARPASVVAAVLLLVGAATAGPPIISHAWDSFTRTVPPQNQADPTTRLSTLSGTRYPLWKVTLNAFDAHPADGTGAGTFEFWWAQHATDDEFVRDSHNIWLQNMAELGMPGLLLIVAVAVAALWTATAVRRRARRRTSAGIAAASGASFLVFLLHASVDWMWQSTAVTVLALTSVAVLAPRLSQPLGSVRLPLRGLLVLCALVAAAVQVPGLLSTAELRRSQSAVQAGSLGVAQAWANDAVSAAPWSASAQEQRGLVEEQTGHLRQAQRELGLAISDEPTNYRHWLIRSRIDAELGQGNRAVSDLGKSHQLRPRASVFKLAASFGGAPVTGVATPPPPGPPARPQSPRAAR